MRIYLAYVAVILIWSTTPLAIKWSSESVGFLFGVSARMWLGALIAWLALRTLRLHMVWHGAAWKTYLAATLGIYGAMLSVYWGAQYVPSGIVALVFSLSTFVTGALAHWLLGERSLTLSKLAGLFFGMAGMAMIFQADFAADRQAALGIAAILLSVLLHSVSAVLTKRSSAGLPSMVVNTGALGLASLLYLLTWLLNVQELPASIPPRAGLAILYLGVFGSVIGFTLYFYALKHVEASKIALLSLITPVTALLLGQALNGEHIGPTIWWGAGVILTGLLIHQWGDRCLGRRAREPAP